MGASQPNQQDAMFTRLFRLALVLAASPVLLPALVIAVGCSVIKEKSL